MGASIAPDANAAAAAAAVAPVVTGPVKSAVSQAADAARATIAAGQSAAVAPPGDGRAALAAVPPVAAAPVLPVPAKPVEGQPAAKPVEAPANETAEQKLAREIAAAAAVETPEQIAAREQAEALQVTLPIGETEDDDLVLTVNSPEVAEQMRTLVEEALGGRALAEEIESMRGTVTEIEELREYADADTIGFTLDMIGTDLNKAKALTMYLLTQPTLYAAVKDDLAKLADPKEFRILALDARDARHTMTQEANERIETSRAVRQNLQDVQSMVDAMLPETLTQQQRQMARRDCFRDLKDYADSKEMIVLPVNQIPTVLANRLTALGIDPEEATARATAAAARKGGSTPTPRRAVAATRTPPKASVAPAPKKDGAAFVTSAAKKREAGAIPTAGAGAPTNPGGLQAPVGADGKKLGIADTIKWAREQRQKGVKFFGQ